MGNILGFIVSFGLFMLGLWVMGVAFRDDATGAWVFTAGILLTAVAIAIPFSVLGRSSQK